MATYKLRAQSIMVLRGVLTLPGWTKSIEDIYRGGKILATVVPTPPNGTPLTQEFEFEMDGPDRDMCKTAFQFAVAKDAVQPSEWVVEIVEQLEFVAKPKAPAQS